MQEEKVTSERSSLNPLEKRPILSFLNRKPTMAEKQQLMLKKEQAYAPARLAMEARELGLKPLLASQVGTQKASRRSQLPLAPALLNPSASFQR